MGALTSKPYAFTARSWELRQMFSFDFFDILAVKVRLDLRGEEVLRVLPVYDAVTGEEYINDRIRFFYDALRLQRVAQVYSFSNGKPAVVSWKKAFLMIIRNFIASLGKDPFSVYPSKNASLFYADEVANFSKLYTNRWCAPVSSRHLADFRSSYFLDALSFFLTRDRRDIVTIGYNLRYSLPLVALWLRKGVRLGKFRAIGVGVEMCDTYAQHFLGSSFLTVEKLLSGRSKYLRNLYTKQGGQVFFLLSDRFSLVATQLRHRFVNVCMMARDIATLSYFEQGKFDKSFSSLPRAQADIQTVVSFKNGYSVIMASHPSRVSAHLVLPVFSVFEQGGFFVNMLGVLYSSSGLSFSSGRQFLRKEESVFRALGYFFELFLTKVFILGVSVFPLLSVKPFREEGTLSRLFDAHSVINLSFGLRGLFFDYTLDLFSVDSLTRASRVLVLAARRFKTHHIF